MRKLALFVVLAATPLAAHHSTRAEYDASRAIHLQGVITEVRWRNPHASFLIDVTDTDGRVVSWEIELPAPSQLIREGYGRNDLRRDDRIAADVWVAKNESGRADARTVTLPGGRTISGASIWDQPPAAAR